MNAPVDNLKIYLVNFAAYELSDFKQTGSISETIERFNQYLLDSVDVVAYWNYIPLLYMIKTRLGIRELTVKLKPFLGDRYLVAQIDPESIDGRLPKEAWDWIYFPHRDVKPSNLMFPNSPGG
ncbi:MAG: hypothetical protein EOS85_05985 [Mesorhizobium sp.]|nr:MAG: hypothetical protein EOS85_05985 [Mesorhizobium sp.]